MSRRVRHDLLVADAIRAVAWRGGLPTDRQQLWACCVKAGRLGSVELVEIGALNELVGHPREGFQRAVREDASVVLFIRTGPGGGTLSRIERARAARFAAVGVLLGVRVLDYLAVGRWGLESARESGCFAGLRGKAGTALRALVEGFRLPCGDERRPRVRPRQRAEALTA